VGIASHIGREGIAAHRCQSGGSFAAGLRITTFPDAYGRPNSKSYRIAADIR